MHKETISNNSFRTESNDLKEACNDPFDFEKVRPGKSNTRNGLIRFRQTIQTVHGFIHTSHGTHSKDGGNAKDIVGSGHLKPPGKYLRIMKGRSITDPDQCSRS